MTLLPTYEPLFRLKEAQGSLEHVIAMHFLTGRTGLLYSMDFCAGTHYSILRFTRESSLKRNLLLLGLWHRFTCRTTVTVCGSLLNIGRLVKQGHQACPQVRVSLVHCTSDHSLARVTIRSNPEQLTMRTSTSNRSSPRTQPSSNVSWAA